MSKYIKWHPLLFCSACSPTASTTRMQTEHMDTAQPSELACLPQEPGVTMMHKIFSSYKTTCVNCRIPSGHWKQLMPHCSEQNSLQVSSTNKIAEPFARFAFAKAVYASVWKSVAIGSSSLAQGCIGSNPVGLANLILTLGANIHLGCFA